MRSEAVESVVAEWLRGAELPPLTPRECSLSEPGIGRPIIAVVGPRRAGKTYLLYQMIGDLIRGGKAVRDEILFIDFEDFRLDGFQPDDMARLLSAFHQLAGKAPRYLFFDEVHRLPSWSRVLRTLHSARKYAIVVTGSNTKVLASEIATELRGRYEDCLVLPFSFREFLSFRKIEPSAALLATPERGLVLRAFDEYLKYGGFPEPSGLQEPASKRRLLQSYFDTVFYKDVLDRYGIRARHLLDLVMRNALESYASLFSISRFADQLKSHGLTGSKRSIAEYLRRLEEVFFLLALEKFDFSPRKRMMNPKKTYLIDTGFSLLGGSFSENRGRLLENVVALELLRRRKRAMYFKGRGECDFVVQEGTRPSEAWQVCWELAGKTGERELNGLAEARRELKIGRGAILTYDQESAGRVEGKTIPVVPVWKWLLGR